jgi:hypothetical protein
MDFHIAAKMNKALDQVRTGESRRKASECRRPILKKSRWLLLKREENLKADQRFRLRDPLRYDLKTVRAYLLMRRTRPRQRLILIKISLHVAGNKSDVIGLSVPRTAKKGESRSVLHTRS